ncbi:terminase family protein [Pendulispora brunnea]|uniref:Terminase family protein n=1 Tax=Pendulispora brunnea TaxID=2905690 RepID=A0ABZ2KHI1_9BACT
MQTQIASLVSLSPEQRAEVIRSLTPEESEQLYYCWRAWARPSQLAPPGDWSTWCILAGRGWGKTRVGAEWVREQVEADGPRSELRIALVARSAADVRDTMLQGESGLLAICPPWNRPRYIPSKRLVLWPSGARAHCYSAEEPSLLRGPQFHLAWADELAAWRYQETWDQLQFGLRLRHRSGREPRVVVTTTPRPTRLIRDLVADPHTVVTGGSTFENQANLASNFFRQIISKYAGTRLGRQELSAEILGDNPGALWQREVLDALRVRHVIGSDGQLTLPRPELGRIVVGVDPAVTHRPDEDVPSDGKKARRRRSNETGIVVAGLGASDHHGYVLEDLSGRFSPADWASRVAEAYHRWGADAVVAEVNQGGDLVVSNLRGVDAAINVIQVRATRNKHVRAEPVSALYEQRRVHHVGSLALLEDQMTSWDPDDTSEESPDRVDALVWAMTELIVKYGEPTDTKASPLILTDFEMVGVLG